MVHLAPLTSAWPADLLAVALILVVKTHANIIYDLFHTTCVQYYHECAYVIMATSIEVNNS